MPASSEAKHDEGTDDAQEDGHQDHRAGEGTRSARAVGPSVVLPQDDLRKASAGESAEHLDHDETSRDATELGRTEEPRRERQDDQDTEPLQGGSAHVDGRVPDHRSAPRRPGNVRHGGGGTATPSADPAQPLSSGATVCSKSSMPERS